MPSPFPKPIAEKAAKGTLRPEREAQRMVPLRAKVVPVPLAPLSFDTEERAYWDDLKEAVDELGIYTKPDLQSFRQMVYALSRVEQLKNGNVNSWLAAQKVLLTFFARFGLTPLDRARWVAPPQEEQKPKEDGLSEFAPRKPRLVPEADE